MDGEFQRLVDAAAEVQASGRWDAANKRIEALAANPGHGNEWRVQLLASLCAEVFSQYLQLKHAFEDTRFEASVVAYFARNLLELSVWAMYCAAGKGNAERLYTDAGRDELGIYEAFEKWGTTMAQPAEFFNIFSGAKLDLAHRAAAEGITSLDADYKRVSDAARECNMAENFALHFKLLSKFAHPTAIRMIDPHDMLTEARQREWFFSWGCLFFQGAFDAIENMLQSL